MKLCVDWSWMLSHVSSHLLSNSSWDAFRVSSPEEDWKFFFLLFLWLSGIWWGLSHCIKWIYLTVLVSLEENFQCTCWETYCLGSKEIEFESKLLNIEILTSDISSVDPAFVIEGKSYKWCYFNQARWNFQSQPNVNEWPPMLTPRICHYIEITGSEDLCSAHYL